MEIDSLGRRRVKANDALPLRFGRALCGRSHCYPDLIVIGADGEPYPKEEKRMRLTRRCLELIAKYNYPAFIITRTALVLRDIDILREIHEAQQVTIAMPLSAFTSKTAKEIGDDSSTPRYRLEVLDRICRSGVQTGILLEHINLNSGKQLNEIEQLFNTAVNSNYDFVSLGIQTLDKVSKKKRVMFSQRLLELADRHRISLLPRRWQPQDYRRENFWLAAKIATIALKLKLNGKSYRAYNSAAKRINNLRLDVRSLVHNDQLKSLLSVEDNVWHEIECFLSGRWLEQDKWEI